MPPWFDVDLRVVALGSGTFRFGLVCPAHCGASLPCLFGLVPVWSVSWGGFDFGFWILPVFLGFPQLFCHSTASSTHLSPQGSF